MASELNQQSLEQAFQGRSDIQAAIRAAAAAGPAYIELFNQISLHICTLTPSFTSEPASKKRRLDENLPNRPNTNGTSGKAKAIGSPSSGSVPASGNDPVVLEVKDISVVIPQRKKYTLCFTSTHLYARLPDSKEPVPGISYAWADIESAFLLPVPEKSQKQHNYVLFPRNSTITPAKPRPDSTPSPEPFVFTIPDSAPKPGSISGLEAASAQAVADDYRSLFDWAIKARLKSAVRIVEADENLFHSVQRQPQRPNEKAVHVKAFRGKPLLFLPHERIAAVSYTSVLQRTFNLSVEVDMSLPGTEVEAQEEFEFSMLDQEDFAGIDEFIKRHGLQDKSMAEQRKAKRLNVNVVKDEEGNVVGIAEAGELEKAAGELEQQEIDEEDEEEEDYDPGSEGDSEGEGSSSGEEDEDGGGGEVEEGDEEDEDD
ncbi:Histone chaperone [Hyphodiscus hymeniophilus]|uniref:Histone chaperone n=1 Tax=Hyphodiscus hymeniophilus TaxID=353542 RepID=A0A9P6SPW6_9HELO|nr:Histone chaperone [Hyphodiscus hymeniophilus]